MKYKLPVSDKIKMTQLIINNLEYEQNYIQYLIPVDAALTAEAGDIEVSFTFLKLVANEDGTYTSYIRKTTSGVIHITPLVQFDKYEPSELFTEIDQRLLAMEGMIKDLNAQNKATYEGMVKDIRLNTEDRKITLTDRNGEDTGNGIVVKDLCISSGMSLNSSVFKKSISLSSREYNVALFQVLYMSTARN